MAYSLSEIDLIVERNTALQRTLEDNLHVGKGPVGTHEYADQVGARCCEDVVDCIGRGYDTFASTRRGTTGLPGYDVAGLFIVKVLRIYVSMYVTSRMGAHL